MARSRAAPAGIAATVAEARSICLWRSLISRYLTWKLRQNAAAQPARLGPVLRPRARGGPSSKAGASSAGSAHSPISTYDAVGR